MDLRNKEIIFIKIERVIEDDENTTNMAEVHIGNQICRIEIEPGHNGFMPRAGDAKIEIEKENMSDVEESEIDKLDVCHVNVEKPKRKRKQLKTHDNLKFLPRVNRLERAGRNKNTNQLITFQSPSGNEQKNITEANRTGENLTRKTQRTDITKLRICSACNKSLRSIKTATDTNNRHFIKLNYKTLQRTSNDTTDSCDMCNKAFPRNAQTFLFKCTFCDFETNSKYRLNTHINARHTKRIRYTCCYCNFKTYVKVKLGSHVNVTHKECLTCLYCGYVAKFKSYLNKHLCAQHSDTKDFSCNFCTYSSKQKGSLDKHVVDVHTEIAASS